MMSQGQQLQPQQQQPQPQQQQPQQQQEQVIHLLLSRAASERQVSGRLTSQPQPQPPPPPPQQQQQVVHLLVSRAARERQVSGRLMSQPDARGGLSGGDESCGGMGGTVRAPCDAEETGRASLICGTGSDGSGTSYWGASGGAALGPDT
eukprot:scaffold71265_cov51-Phaeocystis_antarctica.AAC.1